MINNQQQQQIITENVGRKILKCFKVVKSRKLKSGVLILVGTYFDTVFLKS